MYEARPRQPRLERPSTGRGLTARVGCISAARTACQPGALVQRTGRRCRGAFRQCLCRVCSISTAVSSSFCSRATAGCLLVADRGKFNTPTREILRGVPRVAREEFSWERRNFCDRHGAHSISRKKLRDMSAAPRAAPHSHYVYMYISLYIYAPCIIFTEAILQSRGYSADDIVYYVMVVSRGRPRLLFFPMFT